MRWKAVIRPAPSGRGSARTADPLVTPNRTAGGGPTPTPPRAGSPRDPLAKPRDLASFTKQSIRHTLLTASRPTASARILPGFLIVGPPRCGTPSMYDTLSQHPAVSHPLLPWTREV